MSENDPTSEPLRANPVVIQRYARYLVTPLLFAGMAYAISGAFGTAAIVFMVMLSMSFFDMTKKARQAAAAEVEPQTSASDPAQPTNQGLGTSANAVTELKRKLESLRDGETLDRVDFDNESQQPDSNGDTSSDTNRSDRTGSTFEQEQAGARSGVSEHMIVERMNSPTEVQAARTDPTELQTQIWMQKLRDLDENVAYGKISDEEHERQYRRIMAAYNR